MRFVFLLTDSVFCCLFMYCAEMDLFAVVKLEKPKQVTVGVRPLRENEQPLLEATAGHLTVLGPVGHEDSPPLLVTPCRVWRQMWRLRMWRRRKLNLLKALRY